MTEKTAAEKFKHRSNKGRGASDVLLNWDEPQRQLPKAQAPALQSTAYPLRKARPRRVNTYITSKEGELLLALVAEYRREEQDNRLGEGVVIGHALRALKAARERHH